MLRRVALLCLPLFFGPLGWAQLSVPHVEVYGGYSYANADFTALGRKNLNGWNASAGVKVNRWLGGVADFGGEYGTQNFAQFCPVGNICLPLGVNTTVHTFLFGPQVSANLPKISPFAHALFGVGRFNASMLGIGQSQNSFTDALGGGIDYHLSHNLSWRVQADYLQTRFISLRQNNARFSTGLVLHF